MKSKNFTNTIIATSPQGLIYRGRLKGAELIILLTRVFRGGYVITSVRADLTPKFPKSLAASSFCLSFGNVNIFSKQSNPYFWDL